MNLPNGTVTTAYDAAGCLKQTSASASTQFLYDGSLIAEYNASGGAVINRFVPGAAIDETVAAYDAGGTKSWLHADAQGSVVATSDGSGNAVVINQYGPSGEPGLVSAGRNTGRIRYTGQIYLPELAPTGGPSQPLYSFKARIYAPKLGRFLQTDPIGALDDRNLYAYVGNDPINWTDPSGLFAESSQSETNSSLNGVQLAGVALAPALGGWIAGDVAVPDPTDAAWIKWGLYGVGMGAALGIDYLMNESKPPAGSKPIDKTPWSGDHQDIKGGIGAGPTDNVKISPSGDVWGENPDGSWSNHGPAGDYTGSGKPSGQRGRDRGN